MKEEACSTYPSESMLQGGLLRGVLTFHLQAWEQVSSGNSKGLLYLLAQQPARQAVP